MPEKPRRLEGLVAAEAQYTLFLGHRLSFHSSPSLLQRRILGGVPSLSRKGGGGAFPASYTTSLRATRLRKGHPVIWPKTGSQFPDGPPGGNCIPEFSLRLGCIFPKALVAETATRNPRSNRDELAARRPPGTPGRKPQPSLHRSQ